MAIKARADDPIVVVCCRIVVRVIVVVACQTRQHRRWASAVVHRGLSVPPLTRLRTSGGTTLLGKGSNIPPRSTTPRRRRVVFHVATTTRIMMSRQIPHPPMRPPRQGTPPSTRSTPVVSQDAELPPSGRITFRQDSPGSASSDTSGHLA
jgi:hypothetical protein